MIKRKNSMRRISRSRNRYKSCMRGKLLEKRRESLERLAREIREATQVCDRLSGDMADLASGSVEQEAHFGIGTVESDAVAEIDRALERLDEGSYGICEVCGNAIRKSRLRVLPFAAACLKCQELREREVRSSNPFSSTWQLGRAYDSSDDPNPGEVLLEDSGRWPGRD